MIGTHAFAGDGGRVRFVDFGIVAIERRQAAEKIPGFDFWRTRQERAQPRLEGVMRCVEAVDPGQPMLGRPVERCVEQCADARFDVFHSSRSASSRRAFSQSRRTVRSAIPIDSATCESVIPAK